MQIGPLACIPKSIICCSYYQCYIELIDFNNAILEHMYNISLMQSKLATLKS